MRERSGAVGRTARKLAIGNESARRADVWARSCPLSTMLPTSTLHPHRVGGGGNGRNTSTTLGSLAAPMVGLAAARPRCDRARSSRVVEAGHFAVALRYRVRRLGADRRRRDFVARVRGSAPESVGLDAARRSHRHRDRPHGSRQAGGNGSRALVPRRDLGGGARNPRDRRRDLFAQGAGRRVAAAHRRHPFDRVRRDNLRASGLGTARRALARRVSTRCSTASCW